MFRAIKGLMDFRKLFLLAFVLGICSPLWAHKPGHKHVHGQGELALAFDGVKGVVDLTLPAESVFGFEHSPKNEAETALQERGLLLLREEASQIFTFDASLSCQWKNPSVELKRKKGHADVIAKYEIECARSPKGSAVNFDARERLPRLRRLTVEFTVDGHQGKASLRNGQGEFKL